MSSAVRVAAVLVVCASPARAQEFVHPLEMGLPPVPEYRVDVEGFQFSLNNGLVGFIVGDSSAPIVQLTVYVRAGTADDDRQGAAEVLAAIMRTHGPCWIAPLTLDEALDEIAGDLFLEMTPELTVISVTAPAEEADQVIRLMSGIVAEPCVRERELSDAKGSVASGIGDLADVQVGAVLTNGSMEVAIRLFEHHLYADHPYHEPVTADDLADLDRDRVTRFHQEYFVPTNAAFAVSGLLDPATIRTDLDRRFGPWTTTQRVTPELRIARDLRSADSVRIYRYRANKLQSWVVMGHELQRVRPQDWPALEVMNYILGGGHFDTRLFRSTRDRRGLTHDASGFLEPYTRGPGTYTFRSSSRPGALDELLEILNAEIARIRDQPVSNQELLVAQGALIAGTYPMKFENGHVASQTLAGEYARFSALAALQQYPDRVREVTIEDVQRVAQRYLRPDRLLTVIIEGTAQP